MDLDKLMGTTISYKALLLKWIQQQKKQVSWRHQTETHGKKDLHLVTLFIDEVETVVEKNMSRKKAEELCCEKACRMLQISG